MKPTQPDISEKNLLCIKQLAAFVAIFAEIDPLGFEQVFYNSAFARKLAAQSKELLANPGRIEFYANKLCKEGDFNKNEFYQSLQNISKLTGQSSEENHDFHE